MPLKPGPPPRSPGIIDVHAHVTAPGYLARLRAAGVELPGYRRPGDARAAPPAPAAAGDDPEAIEARLRLMDEAGVERQILSPALAPYLEAEGAAADAARWINDLHLRLAAARPDRFSVFLALPLPHLGAALEELARVGDRPSVVGVALHCACRGRSLADPAFEPLHAALDQRGEIIFFHPCVDGLCAPALNDWGLAPTLGVLVEDAAIALQLVVAGIPARRPRLRFIIPHLGGPLPLMLPRLDNQLPMTWPDLAEAPSATLRRFWYDAVGHGSAAALRCALDAFGAERILAGSDYPVPLAFDGYAATLEALQTAGVGRRALERIHGGNARRLFGARLGPARQPS